MNVTWGDMQTGRFEVLIDGRMLEEGAVVEACTEKGVVRYIPTDPSTGAMLWDPVRNDWMTRIKEGAVQIIEWPRFMRPS